jgi:hypothetical protein
MDGCCDAVRKHPSKLGNAPGIYHVPFAKYISGALVFLSCCGVDVWFMLSSCLELRGGPRLRSGNQFVSTEMGGDGWS